MNLFICVLNNMNNRQVFFLRNIIILYKLDLSESGITGLVMGFSVGMVQKIFYPRILHFQLENVLFFYEMKCFHAFHFVNENI